jgi:hypothetical protein
MEEKTVPAPATTFMAAAKDYFGLLPGQTAMGFGKEVKELSAESRAELTEELKKAGYNITN